MRGKAAGISGRLFHVYLHTLGLSTLYAVSRIDRDTRIVLLSRRYRRISPTITGTMNELGENLKSCKNSVRFLCFALSLQFFSSHSEGKIHFFPTTLCGIPRQFIRLGTVLYNLCLFDGINKNQRIRNDFNNIFRFCLC